MDTNKNNHTPLNKDKDYQYYRYPNESFSGCDMTATIVYSWEEEGDIPTVAPQGKGKTIRTSNLSNKVKFATHVLGEIQTISYSIHMEKRPVRSIGNVNAKDYVMGPRTIAGSLVFAVFNRHFAKNIMAEHNDYFKAGKAFLVDELPPFNIVVSFANEYGLRSKLVIYGVRLLNEGQVMSVNDVFTENTYQFVATDLEYMDDELSYESRDNNSTMFKLKNDWSDYDKDEVTCNDIGRALAHYVDPDVDKIEHINISVSTVDATRNNPNGRATLSLFPLQTEGELKLMNTNNEETIIKVNGSSSYTIQLEPDMYNAKFNKPDPDAWDCDTKFFNIKEFRERFDTKRYAPVIETITDTSVKVYSNEPTHTYLMLKKDDKVVDYYEFKNRRCTISTLDRSQEYHIASCNGPDTILSPTVRFKTFGRFDKPFEDFKKLVEYNQSLLQYKELSRYYTMIDRAKDLAVNTANFESPTDSIMQLKRRYENELKTLSKDDIDYNDKVFELTHNIHVCNELVYMSNKVTNNIVTSVNKEPAVPIPALFLNSNYDNTFEFSKDITQAEFYRVNKGVNQFAHTATANMFANIDDKENSFVYSGKSGMNHFVQALAGHLRSPKLEFYSMTPREKQDMIDEIEGKDTISEQTENKVNIIIKDELGINLDDSVLDRAFMRKVKTITNPKMLDVDILEKQEYGIIVDNPLSRIIDDSKEAEFYISVAKKSDIVNNDFIYKKKITNIEREIFLNDVDEALFNNVDYSLWIEDSGFNQITNITTFNMNAEENINDRVILEYEMSSIIKEIKSRLYPLLPGTIYSSLISEIEFNEEITKSNIIEKTLEYILYCGLGDSVILRCLSELKVFMGYISDNDDILEDISLKNYNDLIFKSSKEASISIAAINRDSTTYYTEQCFEVNSLDLTKYNGDYLIITVLTPDLRYKSKSIFINNLTSKMEVL